MDEPEVGGASPTVPELESQLLRHDLSLPRSQLLQLDRFRALLWDWNTKINLTRHIDLATFVSRDVVDSVQLAGLLAQGEEVLDVGSGGGVPGVLLAILREDLEVTLCDSVGKKARALQSMVAELELPVGVHHERGERVLDDLRFDSVVARAIGPLWKICTWFAPHWPSMGRLLLVKGPRWVEERKEARARGLLRQLDLRRVATFPLAGTSSESVILQLTYRRS
jgi:16S rRNA (guanine527-N7)-methyltransferase